MDDQREVSSASFYQYLAEKKLMAAKCKSCGEMYLPPHPICSKCFGDAMEWVEVKGKGKLAAFTAISVGPSFTLDEGYDRSKPYLVGIVQLDEGPKVSGRINGLNPTLPETVKVGTPVAVEFREPQEGSRCYLAFRAT